MKNLKLCFGLTVLLIAAVAASPALGEEKLELTRKCRTGDKYNMKISAVYQLTQTQQVPDDHPMLLDFGFGIGLEVLEVDATGNTLIKITLHSMRMRMAGLWGPMIDFDSTDPFQINSQQNLILSALLGLNYTVKLDPSGRVLEMKGLDEFIQRVDLKLPNIVQKKSLLQSLRSRLDYQSLAGPAANADFYPPGPVAIGDSWGGSGQLEYNGNPMISEDQYKLVAVQDGTAMVEANSLVKPSATDQSRFSGRQWGVIKIDTATGWIVDLRLNQEFTAVGGSEESRVTMIGTLTIVPY